MEFKKREISLAVAAAMGALTLAAVIASPMATAAKAAGKYVAGDIHNHTTCSDGAISMQKLIKKSTDKTETPWGLDWFVQAGHGGNGNRNCSLVEDATLETPAYPYVVGKGPTTTWANSIGADKLKGDGGGVGGSGNMWRWQSIQEVQYQVVEHLNSLKDLPIFLGLESVVAGHEHTSMSVIAGQVPAAGDAATPLNVPGYTPLGGYVASGNATALAQWSYCFDRGDTDTSRGNIKGSSVGNNWNCAVPGSLNEGDVSWNSTAQKLIPAGGTGTGNKGHNKTVEAMKWMKAYHANGSYYIPTHLERAGPFNADGNNGFNIEHLRNFNNAAPTVAFGFETQPGHGASANRGEYQPNRNNFGGTAGLVDSVGGTTYGGTGVYGSVVGGVWDAMLGEGRNYWFLASSDWHNRGSFGPDDRRSTQDFYPGEYQRNYTMVRSSTGAKLTPQQIVDGMRTGNNFVSSGQLIDRLAFVACASYPGPGARSNATVEALALAAATNNADIDAANCATMGEKLVVRPGAEIVVTIVARDPEGANFSPYTFPNPSLKQIGLDQPLNKPVLDHIDVIRGLVTGYKTPGAADYSGEWPRNTNWLRTDGTTADLSVVPAGAKNTSASIIKTFSGAAANWTPVATADGTFLKMTYRIPAVSASQYVRLRGTNLPAAVPYETDANGNPLADLYTNAGDTTKLRIPCTTVGTVLTGDAINGCPAHLATAGVGSPIAGQKAVSYDVAAWSDLWFYSNPIYIQVNGSTQVAGVQ
ncbi:hypothetical protein VVD49_13500 [Uliginosibacterium sp. H3]|uniref:Uncharacterized protein n=1 Tax=Uliginosibacterium silvisoli TaxID=3114758 RepID=A0ABU6K570_9RHOO|nr:hypothetical protein [Uliginosibacterium sp. H3]